MTRKGIHFGRILLAIGAILSFLVVIETHQNVGSARSLNHLAAVTQPQRSAAERAPEIRLPDVSVPQAIDTDQEPQPTAAASDAADAEASAASEAPASQTVALSTGEPGDRPQELSSLSSNQVAAIQDEWNGASFPLEQFQAYTSPFGYRRSVDGYNFNEFHYGLDMAAPRGSYIRNWWSGTVVEVTDNSNCGTSVVVEAGNWLSIYCHMEGYVESSGGRRYMIDRAGGLQIFEGQEVPAGQRVGRVGMTGRTTGPHLHWGLKFNNNWVDPAMVLRAMYDSQERYSAVN
ncbi:MAG: M23 family metallopeptidase [Kaiparowitsia implicata GSE-PSE-MK54-09C]|jgi:murein DD-endopeptidase MepM/ murein hydrolase activator NlpD|nr:M23 family metallopeptidase [Kaiparowitsia implicata GSE-PSE-MK54-09C]